MRGTGPVIYFFATELHTELSLERFNILNSIKDFKQKRLSFFY